MSSRLHRVCGSKGCPRRLYLSKGQCSDFAGADVLLKDLPPAAAMIGDQGYDSNKIRKILAEQGTSSRRRKEPFHDNKRFYRMGYKIENLFFPL